MTGAKEGGRQLRPFSNAYELFILVLTVLSLVIMVALVLPLDDATTKLLNVYDNLICVVFLFDFSRRIRRASPKRAYFIGERGWLDLIGSIPSVGAFQFAALLRLARLSRLARISRLMREKGKKSIARDVVENRGEYAAFFTLVVAMIVLVLASVLVLQFESRSAQANITNGGDALWWGVVTITTVGYGDYYPVTTLGRITGFMVMLSGVGIIGALASILASVLVPAPKSEDEAVADDASPSTLAREVAAMREEVAALRRALEGGPPAS
jgi:voltage-gated potassium channel